ncbi:hypothetical protein [Pseudooceanicola sp. LIPI14-2-Ac024]|uniref:hypothetical protein n=1 Tax=Pseudooceanicola sp. LIPI14-2-Ac024 TaxID=3344875 RepID=UPI0035D0D0A9
MKGAAFLLLLGLPQAGLAEGARLDLDCRTVTRCNAAGACAPATGTTRFAIEPETLDQDGMGLFTLWQDDDAAQLAQGASRLGPFLWEPVAGTRTSLALSGEGSAVLIRQSAGTTAGPDTGAEIDLMTCEVTF